MASASTISDILKRAGGPLAIEAASNGGVRAAAVYKWSKIGIPDRHWPLVMQLSGASAADLLTANVNVRAPSSLAPEPACAEGASS